MSHLGGHFSYPKCHLRYRVFLKKDLHKGKNARENEDELAKKGKLGTSTTPLIIFA